MRVFKAIADDKGISPTIEWTIIVSIVVVIVSVVFLSFNGTLHNKMVTFGQSINNKPITPENQSIQVLITGPVNVEPYKQYEYTASVSGGTPPYTYNWTRQYIMDYDKNEATYSWGEPGDYIVTVTVTDANGKTGQGILNVKVRNKMIVTISSPLSNQNGACTNQMYKFHATVQNGHYPYTYQWSTEGYLYGRGEDAVYMWKKSGTYTVSVTVTDSKGNKAHASVEVKVSSVQDIQITISGKQNVLTGVKYEYTASVSGGTPPYTYSWAGSKLLSYDGNTAYYKWDSPGHYTVGIVVTDANNNTASQHLDITVIQNNDGPKVTLTTYQTTTGTDQPIIIKASVTGGTQPYTYKWTPSPKRVNGSEATYEWHYPGLYTVQCEVTDANGLTGSGTIDIKVEVHGFNVSVNLDKTRAFKNQQITATVYASGGKEPYTYNWVAHKPITQEGSDIKYYPVSQHDNVAVFKIPATGTFDIVCAVTDAQGNSKSAFAQITVVTSPLVVRLKDNSEGKAYLDRPFDVTAIPNGGDGNYSYQWTQQYLNSVHTSSSLSLAEYIFRETGTFMITCTVTDSSGATASASEKVVVEDHQVLPLSVTITGYTEIYTNQSAIYTAVVKNAEGNCTYSWSTQGLVSGQGTERAIYKFTSVGKYVISCTVTDSKGRTKTASITVTVLKSGPGPRPPIGS